MSEDLDGPKFVQLFGPVLTALAKLGGSARPAEVAEQVSTDLGLTDEEKLLPLPSGGSKFANWVAWARFYLAKAGYIDSSRRGVWTLSDKAPSGEALDHETSLRLFREIHSGFSDVDAGAVIGDIAEGEASAPAPEAELPNADYRAQVLEILQSISPAGFERFCQRLLRESGFQEVSVTGRSGDGGIDGIGILQVNPLVSFKVLFQCKRYKGSVVPSQIRDFRGAMMGRADKGIVISTGSFTPEARKEAIRDGAPPVELVDGDKLVTMLEELELGLTPVKYFRVEGNFFDDYR